MTGWEFIRRIRTVGRSRGVEVCQDVERGKGSHITLYYGSRFTVTKDRRKELSPNLLSAMIRSKAALASKLSIHERGVDRILDPRLPANTAMIDHALPALGSEIVMEVRDCPSNGKSQASTQA